MPGKISLRFEMVIKAPIHQVYRMVSNKVGFEEWLCDSASVIPHTGGRVYLSWNTGYATSGRYLELKPDKQVIFTWRGSTDPAETLVTIKLKKSGDCTGFTLIHGGMWQAQNWAKTEQEIQEGWVVGLRNLSAVLETGPDLRITTRPMLGVYLGEQLTAKNASKIGVPVTEGVRLQGVVDGLGAQKCGLQKNDVLVEIEGVALHSLTDISSVMRGRKAGEVLKVTYYRGQDRQIANMELSPRKTVDLPNNAADLIKNIHPQYTAADQDLFAFLKTLTEESASRKIKKEEWNIKEILAHLILSERDVQTIIHKSIVSESFDFSDNTPARIQALLVSYPTLSELIQEFKHAEAETLAFIAALPVEFTSRKSSFWTLTNALMTFNDHTREHLNQMKAALQG